MAGNVIIIGATLGIGRALAAELQQRGHTIGATGRRTKRLETLSKTLGEQFYTCPMDVSNPDETSQQLASLIDTMGRMDVIVLNAGISNFQGSTDWQTERTVTDINVRGFTAIAHYAFSYFEKKRSGHLVCVSSRCGLV